MRRDDASRSDLISIRHAPKCCGAILQVVGGERVEWWWSRPVNEAAETGTAARNESVWSSHLPDGRPIRVRRVGPVWRVVCERQVMSGSNLDATLSRAVGLPELGERPESLGEIALRVWVARTTRYIERDERR